MLVLTRRRGTANLVRRIGACAALAALLVSCASTPAPAATAGTATSPTATSAVTPAASTPAPSPPRVIVALRAEPTSYVGPCPTTITFNGTITLTSGSAQVTYRFLRSDQALPAAQTLMFDAPATKQVSTQWRLGLAGARTSGWQAIQVTEPVSLTSDRAEFSLQCQ